MAAFDLVNYQNLIVCMMFSQMKVIPGAIRFNGAVRFNLSRNLKNYDFGP